VAAFVGRQGLAKPRVRYRKVLAYHAAVARGNDVDRPRNLAKSVTVE
jgi:glucosamine 6-phosphate synthetase-like amidotransferase/phosphosugar isomerase protein